MRRTSRPCRETARAHPPHSGQAPTDFESGGEMDETEARGHLEECPDCGTVTIRGRWAMEGARTLTDAIRMLLDLAHELEHLRASGLELDDRSRTATALRDRS